MTPSCTTSRSSVLTGATAETRETWPNASNAAMAKGLSAASTLSDACRDRGDANRAVMADLRGRWSYLARCLACRGEKNDEWSNARAGGYPGTKNGAVKSGI